MSHPRRVCLLLLIALLSFPSARAAELAEQAQSLKLVPRDAAFYSASLRLREQFELVANSNWWQRVQQVPVLQIGLIQAEQAWAFPPTPELQEIKDWFDSEPGQQLVDTLRAMGSDEVFLYGGPNMADFIELMVEAQAGMSEFGTNAGFDDGESEPDPEAVKAYLRKFIDANSARIRMPDIVMGFRTDNENSATKQLDTLEEMLRDAMAESPVALEDHFSRKTSTGSDLLVLDLPSNLIPWEDVEVEIDDEDFYQLLRKALDGKQVTIVVGRVGDFLVMSLGDSAEHLIQLGSGEVIISHPAIQKLTKHESERVVNIEFVSGEFLKLVNNNKEMLEDLAVTGRDALADANITDDDRAKIASDIDEFIADMVALLPEPGDMSSIGFLTDRGYESFGYNWSEQKGIDATERLTLLDHLGPSPAAFVVSRELNDLDLYGTLAKWCPRALKDFEIIAVSESEPDEWAKYLEAKAKIMPLLERLDTANREQLIPALTTAQGGLVIDLSVSKKTWCDFMSPANKPLTMPAMMIVMQVSDAEKLKAGARSYFDVTQDTIDMLSEVRELDVPAIQLPIPDVSVNGSTTTYTWPLDPQWGASTDLAPHFAVNDSVAVLGVLPAATDSIMQSSSLAIDSPVAQFDRPLTAATHCDFNQLLDATKGWIDYGFQVIAEQQLDEDNMAFFVKPQLDQMLELTRPLKSATSITYREEGVWVTRSELHIEDF